MPAPCDDAEVFPQFVMPTQVGIHVFPVISADVDGGPPPAMTVPPMRSVNSLDAWCEPQGANFALALSASPRPDAPPPAHFAPT